MVKRWRLGSTVPWVGCVGLLLLAGCGDIPMAEQDAIAPDGAGGDTGWVAEADGAAAPGAEEAVPSADSPNRGAQLVKQATLSLQVDDIEPVLAAIEALLAQRQGELLYLADNGTTASAELRASNSGRQVQMEMRVPAADLTATLQELKALGEVTQTQITAEDVSSQLVDMGARVRNLRQSELALLDIMERSGSVAEILEVSRELSAVRESIERLEAQRQALQGQVNFSTITLTLQTWTPTARPAIATTLGQTWRSATHSMGTLSIGLLRIGLWLLAYSPYWGAVVLVALGYRRWRQSRPVPAPAPMASEEG